MVIDYEILVRFLLAVLWGGIVGSEREYRSKSAGFRTLILISVGACFFTMMSTLIGTPGSADRIASNIVTGIGFLGAGVIFRGENNVTGITTAATIWAVAAIGMGIGAGHYFASGCAGVIIIFVLAVLPYAEKLIDNINQNRVYTISYLTGAEGADRYEKLFTQFNLKYKKTTQSKKDDLLTISWAVKGRPKNHELFSKAIMEDQTIKFCQF